MRLIIQEKNQHSNWRRPGGDPTSFILQTSKSWRKMLGDLTERCSEKGAIYADHFERARSDEEESQSSVNMSGLRYKSCPCLLECHQTGIWPQADVRPSAAVTRSRVQILRYSRLRNWTWQYFECVFLKPGKKDFWKERGKRIVGIYISSIS